MCQVSNKDEDTTLPMRPALQAWLLRCETGHGCYHVRRYPAETDLLDTKVIASQIDKSVQVK